MRDMKNSDKSAFVIQETNAYSPQSGLSKREYFAGLAMQGAMKEFELSESHELDIAERIARRAIRCADELLKQLG